MVCWVGALDVFVERYLVAVLLVTHGTGVAGLGQGGGGRRNQQHRAGLRPFGHIVIERIYSGNISKDDRYYD